MRVMGLEIWGSTDSNASPRGAATADVSPAPLIAAVADLQKATSRAGLDAVMLNAVVQSILATPPLIPDSGMAADLHARSRSLALTLQDDILPLFVRQISGLDACCALLDVIPHAMKISEDPKTAGYFLVRASDRAECGCREAMTLAADLRALLTRDEPLQTAGMGTTLAGRLHGVAGEVLDLSRETVAGALGQAGHAITIAVVTPAAGQFATAVAYGSGPAANSANLLRMSRLHELHAGMLSLPGPGTAGDMRLAAAAVQERALRGAISRMAQAADAMTDAWERLKVLEQAMSERLRSGAIAPRRLVEMLGAASAGEISAIRHANRLVQAQVSGVEIAVRQGQTMSAILADAAARPPAA